MLTLLEPQAGGAHVLVSLCAGPAGRGALYLLHFAQKCCCSWVLHAPLCEGRAVVLGLGRRGRCAPGPLQPPEAIKVSEWNLCAGLLNAAALQHHPRCSPALITAPSPAAVVPGSLSGPVGRAAGSVSAEFPGDHS